MCRRHMLALVLAMSYRVPVLRLALKHSQSTLSAFVAFCIVSIISIVIVIIFFIPLVTMIPRVFFKLEK